MRHHDKLIALLCLTYVTSIAGQTSDTLPPDFSREPNCIEGTTCIGKDDIYIGSAVPDGFSREPDCAEHTICVSNNLYLVQDDFMAIKELIDSEFDTGTWEITDIRDVMEGIVVVTAQTKDRGWSWGAGKRFLLEKGRDGWKIIRDQTWIV
jgi:hypothetical protein